MSHWLTFHEFGPARAGKLFRHPRFALVEQVERLLDRVAHIAFGRGRDLGAILEGLVDQGLKANIGHGLS